MIPLEQSVPPLAGASWSPIQWIVLSIAFLTTLVACAILRLKAKKQLSPFEHVPVVPGAHWFHGHLKHLLGDEHSLRFLFSDYADEHGLVAFWLLKPTVAIIDAKHARTILRQGAERTSHSLSKRHTARALGDESLIFSEGGVEWMRQRRLVQYAFSALALVDYRPPTFEVMRNVVASLKKMCKASEVSGKRVEINAVFLGNLFTMDVFGKVAFGYSLNCVSDCDDYSYETGDNDSDTGSEVGQGELKLVKKSKVIKAFEFILDDLAMRISPKSYMKPSLQLYWLPTKRNRENKRQMNVIDNFLGKIIQERKDELMAEKQNQDAVDTSESISNGLPTKKASKRDNMLTRFIRQNEDATAVELTHSIKTLLISGYETTAITISFALYNISMNPRCQERCAEEAKRIFDKYGGDMYEGVIDEHEFKYIYATIMESIRLKPTVLLSQRKSSKVINIGKATLPIGTTIMIPLCELLKSERNFVRADTFCPERWVRWDDEKGWVERDSKKENVGDCEINSPGPISKNPQYQEQNAHAETIPAGDLDNYLAFSNGVRDCVGKRLARLETVIFFAYIMKEFVVDYDTTRPPLVMQRRLITNFPHNLPIIFRRREW